MRATTLKKRTLLFSLFFIAFSISSCITYKEVKVVKIVDSGIKKFSTKGIEIEVAMQIKNPNNYKISIVNSDLDLLAKGNRIGTASIDNKITLPKKSNKIHRFIIKASMKDMASGALPILMSVIAGNPIDLQIKGDIKAKAKGLSKKFPVDFKERVRL
jgi:LEA14-like dessication related protein